MPTKAGGYYLADGTRVPSVSTILSNCALGGCDGLVAWAANLAKEGKDWKAERDKAADAGTMAHAAVEAWIHGQAFAFDGEADVCKKAQQAFAAFLDWTNQSKLVVTHTEMPLVSERHRYGGTMDAVTKFGKRTLTDWKSSNSVQPKMLIQVKAYEQLWNENFPDDPITGGFDLLRFDKQYGDFHHHHWNELDAAWEAFLGMRRLYDIHKELRKRAA